MHAIITTYCNFIVILSDMESIFPHADFPLERKMYPEYEDSVYEIIREEKRGNVLLIANITQHGLSGLQSSKRTAFFTFFGKSV